MTVLPYARLGEVRHAILSRRKLSFFYRNTRFVAEPHLLGNVRKTHALVLCAWSLEPHEGWQYFRFAEIRDVEVLKDSFSGVRQTFNPYDPKFVGIDTLVRKAG